MKKFLIYSTAIAVATLALGAGVAVAENQLIVGFSQDLRGTNPGVDRDGNTDTVHMHVVEGLVAYGADFNIEPMLAESWVVSDDGLTYTFKLRENVPFHNGDIMTSEHVKWSWDRFMNPDTGWRCRGSYSGDNGLKATMEIPDKNTVVYALSEPSATFLSNLARFDCGNTAVMHQSSVDENGKWVKPVGTGPFTFGDIAPGRFVDLKKFDRYASRSEPRNGYAGEKEVLVDSIRLQILSEAAVSKAAFLAGELDLLEIQASDIPELENAENTQIAAAETAVWDTILINSSDPVLKDKRIRQAIAMAIDRDQVISVISEGRGKANPSPLPPVSSFFTDAQSKSLGYDPEKARQLLHKAGYDGAPVKLLTNRNAGAYYERALIVQSMLKEIGFNVELEVLEWGTQLDAYRSGEYQMQSFTYSPRLDPALSFEMIAGDQTRKVWKNPDAIALVNQAMKISDRKERQNIIDQLHAQFVEEVPAVGLGHQTGVYAVRDNVEGFAPWGSGKPVWWGVSKK